MKRVISVLLTGMLCIGMLYGCGNSGSAGTGTASTASSSADSAASVTSGTTDALSETVLISIAAAPSGGGFYAFYAGIADALNTVYPNFNVTCTETSGSVDASNKIRAGELDFGVDNSAGDWDNYYGEGSFEGDPFPEARCFLR